MISEKLITAVLEKSGTAEESIRLLELVDRISTPVPVNRHGSELTNEVLNDDLPPGRPYKGRIRFSRLTNRAFTDGIITVIDHLRNTPGLTTYELGDKLGMPSQERDLLHAIISALRAHDIIKPLVGARNLTRNFQWLLTEPNRPGEEFINALKRPFLDQQSFPLSPPTVFLMNGNGAHA